MLKKRQSPPCARESDITIKLVPPSLAKPHHGLHAVIWNRPITEAPHGHVFFLALLEAAEGLGAGALGREIQYRRAADEFRRIEQLHSWHRRKIAEELQRNPAEFSCFKVDIFHHHGLRHTVAFRTVNDWKATSRLQVRSLGTISSLYRGSHSRTC